jgi:uncharacterized protein YjbJ (UPF0337 family)
MELHGFPAGSLSTCLRHQGVDQERRIHMPDHDRVEGAGKNLGGKLKEAAGKVTGDEKLKAEGRADQVEGKVQNTVGGVKDSLRDNRN